MSGDFEAPPGTLGFIIEGANAGDIAGRSVANAGDVNGDGWDDILIGSPSADPDGVSRAGESYVVFGKADGSRIELSDVAAGLGGFVIEGERQSGAFGDAVSGAGDVDGDGLDDLVIGSKSDASGGSSFVVFGKTDGTKLELSDIRQGNGGFHIAGAAPGDGSGDVVGGGGDVNGDGLDDVIVGAFGADPNGVATAGASYVVFGKNEGDAVPLDEIIAGTGGGFAIQGIDVNDRAGVSVAIVGDMNNDGLAEALVSARLGDPDGQEDAGESYIVFGKTDADPVDLAQIAAGNGGFIIEGIDAEDTSGITASAAGDVNGDGRGDVIISAFGGDPNGETDAGEFYVVFGKGDGEKVELQDVVNGNGGFVIEGVDSDDISRDVLVFNVAPAGDVNADGLDDVVIGAFLGDPGGREDAGETYVVFGKTDGNSLDFDDIAAGNGGFVIEGIAAGDRSGGSVSGGGDINGDGHADIIIGAAGADPDGAERAGETYVVFGKSDTATVQLANLERSDQPSAPTWTVTANPATVTEGNSVTFTIARSHSDTNETVFVSTVQDQGSTNNNDYGDADTPGTFDGILNKQLNFAANDPDPQFVTVSTNVDGIPEPQPETFGLIVQGDANDPIDTFLAATTFTIEDAVIEPPPHERPVVKITSPELSTLEPAFGSSVGPFVIVDLVGTTSELITVPWEIDFASPTGKSAEAIDFSPEQEFQGEIQFHPGDSIQLIPIKITGDFAREPEEFYRVVLGTPQGPALVSNDERIAIGKIEDRPSEIDQTFLIEAAQTAIFSYEPTAADAAEYGWTPIDTPVLREIDGFSSAGVHSLEPSGPFTRGSYVHAYAGNIDGVSTTFISFRGTDPDSDSKLEFISQTDDWSFYYDYHKNFIKEVVNWSQSNNIEQILVSGHSLGGILAELFAADRENYPELGQNAYVVTFGSPGSPARSSDYNDDRLLNVVHTDDPVASLDNPIFGREGQTIYVNIPPAFPVIQEFDLFFEHDRYLYKDTASYLSDIPPTYQSDGIDVLDYWISEASPKFHFFGFEETIEIVGELASTVPELVTDTTLDVIVTGGVTTINIANNVFSTAANVIRVSSTATIRTINILDTKLEQFTNHFETSLLQATTEVSDGSAILSIDYNFDKIEDARIILEGDYLVEGFIIDFLENNYTVMYTGEIEYNRVTGTDSNNVLNGTNEVDRIEAMAGSDRITALDGNDIIFAGDGNDRIDAGAGEDTIFPEGGRDQIVGGPDADTVVVRSGDGNDFWRDFNADQGDRVQIAYSEVIDGTTVDAERIEVANASRNLQIRLDLDDNPGAETIAITLGNAAGLNLDDVLANPLSNAIA